MPNANIVVYGTNWCGDCYRSRRFLTQHQIAFTWINIETNREGERFVLAANHGKRRVPTILFPDGSVLVEPSNQALAQKLGISDD